MPGVYRLYQDKGKSFNVYCDFASEPGWVWTLVMSQSHANRAMEEFRRRSLDQNAPFDEENPSWAAYRLSLRKMSVLKAQSSHWRITCNFSTHGVDYTDYVRADFSKFNILTYRGLGFCKEVEYMNVRGHDCANCTSAWWQSPSVWFPHLDSSLPRCAFGRSPGAASSEDNFGFYERFNPAFRCSSSDSANTNHWFGRRVA